MDHSKDLEISIESMHALYRSPSPSEVMIRIFFREIYEYISALCQRPHSARSSQDCRSTKSPTKHSVPTVSSMKRTAQDKVSRAQSKCVQGMQSTNKLNSSTNIIQSSKAIEIKKEVDQKSIKSEITVRNSSSSSPMSQVSEIISFR